MTRGEDPAQPNWEHGRPEWEQDWQQSPPRTDGSSEGTAGSPVAAASDTTDTSGHDRTFSPGSPAAPQPWPVHHSPTDPSSGPVTPPHSAPPNSPWLPGYTRPPSTAPAAKPRNRNKTWFGALVAVMAVILLSAILVNEGLLDRWSGRNYGSGSFDPDTFDPGSGVSTAPDVARPSSAPPPTSTSTKPGAGKQKPIVTGWQPVVVPDFGLVYDVPQKWKVQPTDARVGFETKDPSGPFGYRPLITASGAAQFTGGCEVRKAHWAQSAIIGAGELPLDVAAAKGAVLWLQGASMGPDDTELPKIDIPKATKVTLSGGITAMTASAEIDDPYPSPSCPAPKVAVTTMAVTLKSRTRILVVQSSQGDPKSLSTSEIATIAKSLRTAR